MSIIPHLGHLSNTQNEYFLFYKDNQRSGMDLGNDDRMHDIFLYWNIKNGYTT